AIEVAEQKLRQLVAMNASDAELDAAHDELSALKAGAVLAAVRTEERAAIRNEVARAQQSARRAQLERAANEAERQALLDAPMVTLKYGETVVTIRLQGGRDANARLTIDETVKRAIRIFQGMLTDKIGRVRDEALGRPVADAPDLDFVWRLLRD